MEIDASIRKMEFFTHCNYHKLLNLYFYSLENSKTHLHEYSNIIIK